VYFKRRHGITLGLVILAGGVFLASALADPPPGGGNAPIPSTRARAAITFVSEPSHERPVAGHLFAGLVVVDTSNTPDRFKVACGRGTIRGMRLALVRRSFYNGWKRNVVTCSWRVPKSARGLLRVSGSWASTNWTAGRIHPMAWRVRR